MMRQSLLLLLLVISLTGCDGPPRFKPLSTDAVILSFGDSLTHGSGATAEQSYPVQLQQLVGHTVIRAGVPGEVSAAGLKRLPQLLEQHRPELLILCHGGNDLLRKLGSAQLRANLQAMIDIARQQEIQILLIEVPKPSLLLSVEPLYAELAELNGLAEPITALEDILSDNRLKSDSIHPNAAGYRQLAEAVAQRLRDQGAL
jgi:lysophospholipase L1-like esterase